MGSSRATPTGRLSDRQVADGHGDFGGGPDESGKDAEEKVKRENPTCTVTKVEKKSASEVFPTFAKKTLRTFFENIRNSV